MPDDKPPQPPEKPTVQIDKVPPWAIALTEKVATGFQQLSANISLVSSDIGIVKERVVILEKWKVESDERQNRSSGGVRQLSETDSKHEAAIASIIVGVGEVKAIAQQALDKAVVVEQKTDDQTIKLNTLTDAAAKLWANPLFRSVVTAAGAALLTWLGQRIH